MGWDRATPFIIDLQVGAEDIDGLGHANNAVYVTWLERCAWRHSQRLGLDLVEYRRLDRAMAVVRHEIDYLAAAYEGDELQLATWIVDWDQRLKMTRHFQLKRPSDNTTLLRAQTTFVCIELSTGKPKRMPAEFIEGYGPALLSQDLKLARSNVGASLLAMAAVSRRLTFVIVTCAIASKLAPTRVLRCSADSRVIQ